MNNKSDKKHKPKHKKTAHQSKKKKEIKSGGAFSISSFFSKNKPVELMNKKELEPLLPKNTASGASINQQKTNSNNSQLNVLQPQPNAQPQGFKTIESQSRCSIL